MKSLAPVTAFLRSARSASSHSFSSDVKVSVWWDFENCPVPNGVNAVNVSKNIVAALRLSGIRGPVTITAFGDSVQLSKPTQEALTCTGVVLNHVPSGGKNTADRSLLADLVFWVSQNPPPAYIFLISTDKDFANILHRLRMNNYNILLASKDPAPGVLCSAASIKWAWYDLVKEEKFSCKLFNDPPDGTSESWYSHHRGPLEDPLAYMEQPTCVEAEESAEAVTAPKLREIPEATVNQIRYIVNSYPEGLDISLLRSMLGKNNVAKNLFGYKKFSHLLESLPTILKLKSSGSKIFAHGILPKAVKAVRQPKNAKQVDSNVRDCTNLEYKDDKRSSIVTAELSKTKKTLPTANKASPPSAHSPPKTDHPPNAPIEKDVILTEGQPSQVDQKDSISEVGFYQRARKIIFDDECDTSNSRTNDCTERGSTTFGTFEVKKDKEKPTESIPKENNRIMSEEGDERGSTTFGTFEVKVHNEKPTESIPEENNRIMSEEGDEFNPRVGIFSNIAKWFKSWSSENTVGSDKETNHMSKQIDTNQLSSKASFGEDRRLNNSKGASVISQSTIREEPGKLLEKEGPSSASSFSSNTSITDVLTSMLQEKLSHSDLQRPPSCGTGDRKKKDTQHGACSNESDKKSLRKSKKEILDDCHMLVVELFKQHPEGFNMGVFKTSFRLRYGYDLEYQKLGYWKLAYLLERIPGVEISFNFVLPSERSSNAVTPYNSQNDGAVKVSNLDSDDTLLNEHSPITETKSKSNGLRSGIVCENTDEIEDNDYGDSRVLEGFSELEEEIPDGDGSDGKNLTSNDNDAVTIFNHDSDSMWNEYLPPSKTKSKNNCFRSEITSEKIRGLEFVKFDDSSSLPDKSQELEEEFSEENASDVKRMRSKNEVDSSLLQLLNSYYSKKDESVEKLG